MAKQSKKQPLSAAVNPEAVSVEDILADFNSDKPQDQFSNYYQAYKLTFGQDLPDESEELIASVIAEKSGDDLPLISQAKPDDRAAVVKTWAEYIHEARALEGPSDKEITDDVMDAVRIATKDHALAVEAGQKLSQHFQDEVKTTVENDIRKQRLPYENEEDMVDTFGLQTILDVWPWPGSKGKSVVEGNQVVLYDKYVYGTDDSVGDFYKEMYLASPQGMADQKEVDWSKDAHKDAIDQSKLPEKWRGVAKDGAGNIMPLSEATCKEMAAPAMKRISQGTAMLRRVVGWIKSFHLIKQEFTAINVQFTQTKQEGPDGKMTLAPSKGPTPIVMSPNGSEPGVDLQIKRFGFDTVSKLFIGTYPETETNKLERIRELVATGTTQWAAVMGAIKRKAKGEGDKGKGGTNVTETLVPHFTTPEHGRQGLQEVAAYYVDEHGDMIKERHDELTRWIATAKGTEREDRILTVGNAGTAFKLFLEKIEPEYNAILRKRLAGDGDKGNPLENPREGKTLARKIADQHNKTTKPKGGFAKAS